jgi:hypothetical protein
LKKKTIKVAGRMLKIKWTDKIKNNEVYQRVKEERLLFKILKN